MGRGVAYRESGDILGAGPAGAGLRVVGRIDRHGDTAPERASPALAARSKAASRIASAAAPHEGGC